MLKRLLLGLTHHSGLNAMLRRSLRTRLLTLCYHTVLPASEIGTGEIYRNTVSLEELREQLEILARWFELVSAERVLAVAEGEVLRRPSALITFDDGHHNLLEHAAPLLERMGVPAIIHVATGHIGTDAPLWTEELAWIVMGWRGMHLPSPTGGASFFLASDPESRELLTRRIRILCKSLPDEGRAAYLAGLRAEGAARSPERERAAFRFLDWNGVRELRRRGFVIGSHTVDHPILTRLAGEALDHQLTRSRAKLESELGSACHFVAYPNGGSADVSQRVFDRASLAGYRVGFTTMGGFAVPALTPMALGRVCIPGRLPRETFCATVSGVQHWWRRTFSRS